MSTPQRTSQHLFTLPPSRIAALLVALLLLSGAQGRAQDPPVLTTSIYDGATPPGTEAGSPAGSYVLSGFETVNLFSGGLNFALPLLPVGGRGEAGYTITLRLEHRWKMETRHVCGSNNCDEDPAHSADPTPGPIDKEGGYGPGFMSVRNAIRTVPVVQPNPPACQEETVMVEEKLTRYTFTGPDGSGTEFRDVAAALYGESTFNINADTCQQEPMGQEAEARGRVFMATDGSGTIFVTDQEVVEDTVFQKYVPGDTPDGGAPKVSGTGNMMFRNGTLYRIEGGFVHWIRDRHGNVVWFKYNAENEVSEITDSLNRKVFVCYKDDPCQGSTTAYDRIIYKGTGGIDREIKIHYSSLENLLCNDPTNDPLCPGNGPGTDTVRIDHLFTQEEKGDALDAQPAIHNPPSIVASVEIPDGRSYGFKYNLYQELSRVTLPTGGAIEYRWGPGVTDNCGNIPAGTFCGGLYKAGGGIMVYRRILERRTLPDGSSVEGNTRYAYSVTPGCLSQPPVLNACTVVTVDQYEGSGTSNLLRQEKHHYYHSPLNSVYQAAVGYSPWRSGKEFKTEIFGPGNELLQRTETEWEQRAAVSWWTGTDDEEPPNDPRVKFTDTTLITGSSEKTTRREFAYSNDVYNNQTDIKTSDYGTSVPGSSIRRTHIDYKQDAAYDASGFISNPTTTSDLTTYLPSLKVEELLCDGGAGNCDTQNASARSQVDYDVGGTTTRSSITGHDTSSWSVCSQRG